MDKKLQQLETLLIKQTESYEKLLSMLKIKRSAFRAADHQKITHYTEQENQLVQTISEREKQRLKLVGELTLTVSPNAKEPMNLAQLADHLDEPERGRLLVMRQQLKNQMIQTQKETAIAKRATESLVRHMQGLIQTVSSAVTGITVYSHDGAIPQKAMAVNTFNVTA